MRIWKRARKNANRQHLVIDNMSIMNGSENWKIIVIDPVQRSWLHQTMPTPRDQAVRLAINRFDVNTKEYNIGGGSS